MSENREFKIKGRLFNEKNMFARIERTAANEGLEQTSRAIIYMRNHHEGQFRRKNPLSDVEVPYINHPLMMACHATALGIHDDVMLTSILIHDVVEDTGVTLDDLPFSDEVKQIVSLLTFTVPEGVDKETARTAYYERISHNPKATIIKLIDRCNNVSTMAGNFTKERLVKYVKETEKHVMPLFDIVKRDYPEYRDTAFILKYHISSVLEAVKNLII